ncbi:hypothetical protein [Streptomyces avermitilis]|uniref:hypothetical protein n=1 Tax=Streptomyces avermitilis TaxID=33903 RepID=UPI0038192D5A
MSNQLADPTTFIGLIGRGKAPLPGDADADQYAAVLRRALHTVECRELGPEAAGQKFGPFADTADGRVTVLVEEDQIRHRHPGHDELNHLTRAVRERGPAVDVIMVPPKTTMLFMDEMAHVASKAAEPASGPALAGAGRSHPMGV